MATKRLSKASKEAMEIAKDQKVSVLKNIVNIFEQIPSMPSFGWGKDAIQNAIMQHDQGYFFSSELLYHAMRREPRIYAALRTRVEAHRSRKFKIKVPDGSPEIVRLCAKSLESQFDTILSKQNMSEILSRMIMFGFCIARHQLVYDETAQQLMPQIVPWSHSYCYYEFSGKKFHVSSDNLGDISVNGDPWIVFSTGGERPWLNGAMRALAMPFGLLNLGFDGWANYNDDESRAYKHLSVPVLKREQTETDSLYQHVAMSRAGDTIITAADTTFDFVSPKGRAGAYKTYEDLARMQYDTISIVLLGNNLVQEVKGGSYAAATAANGLAREIIESDTENIELPINQDTLRLWTDLNFTPQVHNVETMQPFKPIAELATENVENEEIKTKSAQQYADSLQKFISSVGAEIVNTIQIDWKEAARKAGVPLLEDRMAKEEE